MSDKVKELAEELYCPPDERWSSPDAIERIIRTALEPLLEAAQHGVDISSGEDCPECAALAAELQNWTARNPDGRNEGTKEPTR